MWKAVFALIVILGLSAPPLVWWFGQRPVPELEGSGSIRELSKPVVVGFDTRDVPCIQSESEDDMFAAQGFIVARERMFQMDILRRSAKGLIAEVFGLEFLPSDRLVRTIGFERLAKEELEKLTPGAKAALDAYCRGVNSYLEEYSDRLPLEFTLLGYRPRPWTAQDTLAICKYLNYELDESWKLDELRWRVTSKIGDIKAQELFADDYAAATWSPLQTRAQAKDAYKNIAALPQNVLAGLCLVPGLHEAAPPESPLWGSTAWVLSSKNSKSGACLLAADKHGPFTAPNQWMLLSMSSPTMHVAGAAIPGVPGVVTGRNDYIAWSGSSLRADVQDLFVEHFDSELGSKYKTAAGQESAVDFREVIPVRFGKSVEHRITITKHGPILFRDKESAVALSWTGFDTSRPMLNSLYAVNKAGSYDAFELAVSNWGAAPQMFVCADTAGTYGCHASGLVPVRSGGGSGTTMSEGWMGRGEWTSYLTFDDLPHEKMTAGSADRKSGNFSIAAGQRIAQGKLLGHQWAPPYRANRIALALPRGQNKIDLSDCNSLQADHFAMLSHFVCDELKRATTQIQSIEAVQTQALDLMGKWDGMVQANSCAASVYESFMTTMARRLVEPHLGPELTKVYLERWPLSITFVEHVLRDKPMQWLPPDERNFDGLLITTFAKANTRLNLFFKGDDVSTWQWQKIHSGTFRHDLSNGIPWLGSIFSSPRIPLGGDSETIDCCDYPAFSKSGAFEARNGPLVRLLFDLKDSDKFYATIALGQSGHFFSPYKEDQIAPWVRCDTLAVAFSAGQSDKQNKYKFYISRR